MSATPGWQLRAPDLETPRLTLRPLEARDVVPLQGWQSDPASTRYLPYEPRSRDQVAAFVDRFGGARERWHDGDRVVFAVVRDEDAAVIGEVHLASRRHAVREVELGWVFSPEVAGGGYATEASRAVRDLALGAGAHRVVAEVDPRNTASARLCARLGMRQEPFFRADLPSSEGWLDTAIWALVEGDPLP
ncbi:MAG: GNAT family N-acetyltransferase [Micrococcales bacterium]|nr:GNAT family N-acetyltransferase [Micrococcales bacterium]